MKNLKNLKFLSAALIASSLFIGCSKDDDPQPIEEEEVITTMTITLEPVEGGAAVTLETRDPDADGPLPVQIQTGNLASGVTYNGSIVLLNETEDPAEDVTIEVEMENLLHQFFFDISDDLDIEIYDLNLDDELELLGTSFTLTAGDVSTSPGTLTITLIHDGTKPNEVLENTDGETDIDATFEISVL